MGKIVVGNEEDDIHGFGKRILGFLLESSGYEVVCVDTGNKGIKKLEERNEELLAQLAAMDRKYFEVKFGASA